MGNIVDISKKRTNEPTFLHIGENKTYLVNTKRKAVEKVMEIINEKGDNLTAEDMNKILKIAIGEEAFKEIDEDEDMYYSDYQLIIKSIMAIISGTSLEEFEKRFQDATK